MTEVEPKHVLNTLIETASPYWGAERETVVRFLSQPIEPETHIRALSYLAHKEAWGSGLAANKDGLILGPVNQILDRKVNSGKDIRFRMNLTNLSGNFGLIGTDLNLEDYQSQFMQIVEESNDPQDTQELTVALEELEHFSKFASLSQERFGVTLTPLSVKDSQSPWDLSLQRLRTDIKNEGELGKAAVQFTEGGGAAIFHGMMDFLDITKEADEDTKYIKGWAKLGQEVFMEEVGHMKMGVKKVVDLIGTEEELIQVNNWVEDISLARVRMRNEIFGNPLEKTEIIAIGFTDINAFIPEPLQSNSF